MLRNLSLRVRLLFGVIGIVVVVLVLITAISFFLVRASLEREVQSRVLNLVDAEVQQIDGFFNSVGRIPVVLGNASAMDRENNEMLLRARMREVVEKNPEIYGSTISFEPYTFYPDQKYFAPYYYRGGPGGEIEYVQFGSDDYIYWEWEWYTGPRDTGDLYWTQPFFDEGAGDIWMVTAAYPVVRNGKFIAVATVDIPIESVTANLDALRIGTSGYALMFDRAGGVVAASGIPGLEAGDQILDWTAQLNNPQLAGLFDQAAAGERGLVEIDDILGQAGKMWAIYNRVPSTDWYVLTFVSSAEMLEPVTELSLIMIALSLGGVLALAFSVYAIATTITRPVETLRSEALAIAAGDLSRRVPVEGRDEITTLSQAFNQMADELAALLAGLERRVAERTAKLQAAAEVSRTTTSVLDPAELLTEIVELVHDRFNLYYVGLFLLDPAEEYAVLRAGTGEAGRQMLERGHQLAVGGGSMIGQCVARSEARIALDVGEEAVRFDNPFLPDTRSEMALPLRSRGRVIGAMSVQSTQEAAFEETDISVMQTMADQVATALDNARLFEQSQQSLEAERRAYGQFSRDAWLNLLRARPDLGYLCNPQGVQSVAGEWQGNMLQAGKGGEPVAGPDGTLAVPLKIRGHAIGVVRLRKPPDSGNWSASETQVVESLTAQLSAALEGVRLHQDTVRRAAREQLVSEVTTHIRQTLDLDTVLKTAAAELRQALDLPELSVRLTLPDTPASDENNGASTPPPTGPAPANKGD